MTMQGEKSASPRADKPRGRLWIAQVICLIYAAFVMVENVQEIAWGAYHTPGAGTLGGSFSAGDMTGVSVIGAVSPGGGLAKAGVAAGDKIKFDQGIDARRHLRENERVGLTVHRAGQSRHVMVIAGPRNSEALSTQDWLALVYNLATTTAALVAAFIIWRGGASATTLLLGMGILTYGLITPEPELLVSSVGVYPLATWVGGLNLDVIPILFYAFALRFYEDCVGPLKRSAWIVLGIYAGIQMMFGFLFGYAAYTNTTLPIVGSGAEASTIVSYAGFLVCFGYLIVGWRRSHAKVQQRYALMLVATAAIIVSQALDTLGAMLAGMHNAPLTVFDDVHLVLNSLLTGVVASGLFTYSILRHRVFDLGFAVNRTLVYGVVSALLLTAFGAIEWAVDHFVPIDGREKNALVDAAIAVGVFLTFHRVRDLVEHAIEGLFFRRWQKAERDLRRFVREAPFITEAQPLMVATLQALGAYAEGAPCAIYMADGAAFTLAAGKIEGAPDLLAINAGLLVRVRADLKAFEVEDGAFAHSLVAPMANRNEVAGICVIAPKPSGLAWRPDEVDLVGWAAAQVGLDLHALQVERLTAVADNLRQENVTLRSLIPKRA
jgi:hypothetical protein